MKVMNKQVVVTGLGIVSPLGIGKEDFSKNLSEGKSGVGPIKLFDASGFPTRIAAEVKGFEPGNILSGMEILSFTNDRRTLLAHSACRLALEDSGINRKDLGKTRCGVILGSGIHPMISEKNPIMAIGLEESGQRSYRDRDEFKLRCIENIFRGDENAAQWVPVNLGAVTIAHQYGIKGPCYTVISACAASSQAIGEAYQMIRREDCDLVITGGYDSMIFPFGVAGFCLLGTMSTRNDEPERSVRPFDLTRDGFVLGEGAGILIVEELHHALRRGAPVYGEIIGYGTSVDAYSVADPHPEGTGAILAMERAIKDAGIALQEIEYINAHGTATIKNDRIETKAIKTVFGSHAHKIPVSSSKSLFGHLMGAAGALELLATLIGMYHNFLPPTINYEIPDPECDLDYIPNRSREKEIEIALSNSFGFGGQNSTLIVKRTPRINS
jgi:3-oxoacyl-[acyl-carrier-protein] synthase II